MRRNPALSALAAHFNAKVAFNFDGDGEREERGRWEKVQFQRCISICVCVQGRFPRAFRPLGRECVRCAFSPSRFERFLIHFGGKTTECLAQTSQPKNKHFADRQIANRQRERKKGERILSNENASG